ncbi:MAG: hypothetical protein Q4E53_05945 [Eubacteriales bacterium]|nr:hypothetical protein [Eubacteriales bacterium]
MNNNTEMHNGSKKIYYHHDINPERIYANFYLMNNNFAFTNMNLKSLLLILGKYTYQTQDIVKICRLLKEDYNRYYHYNRIRRSKRRMSVRQITSLLRSYYRFPITKYNGELLVRIPFSTIPLIYFVLRKYTEISSSDPSLINQIHQNSIGQILCSEQILIIQQEMERLIGSTSDIKYIERCTKLQDEVLDTNGLLAMDWTKWQQNDIDFVEKHWQ